MEFVNVAGMATSIHHTMPTKKSLPFPLTRELTSFPSSSATYKDSSVLITRNTLCDTSNRISLLLTPGITILSSRNKFRKNSRFSSTFLRPGSTPAEVVLPLEVDSCCRCRAAAAFCSWIALRMRFIRATKRVR
jgi:hypothetical protein